MLISALKGEGANNAEHNTLDSISDAYKNFRYSAFPP